MPSSLTHYFFANKYSKSKELKNVFLLANQGPDPFFFYGYSLNKRENSKKIRDFGNYLHHVDLTDFYMEMLKYSFNSKDNKDLLLEFTRGFIYHYCLDRNIHPFVFYHSGFPYTNKKYNIAHTRYESIIDTLLSNRYIPTRKSLKCSKKEVKLCSLMIYECAKKVFNIDYINKDSYYKAWKDFRFVRLIVDSRFGVKKWLFSKFLKDSPINLICQPKKVLLDKEYDYLNRNKNEWLFPSTGEKINYSIFDLENKAKEDARIIDNIIYNFKDNLVTKKKISKFINNINHDGYDINSVMIYFKLFNELK